MGEIKSTLDLVMEKTRHLSLSEEEKEEQRCLVVKKKIMGMLKKYEDGVISAEQVRQGLGALKKTHSTAPQRILKNEIIDRLNFDNSNDCLSVLLKDIFGIDTTRVASLVNEHQNAVREASLKRTDAIRATLLERFFISGSAVAPNLEANEQWLAELKVIRTTYDQIMERTKAALKAM